MKSLDVAILPDKSFVDSLSQESPREPAQGRFLGSFSPLMAWEPSALGPLVSIFDEPTLGFLKFPGSPLLPEVFPVGFLTPLSIDSSDDDDEDSEMMSFCKKQKQKHSSMPDLHHQYHHQTVAHPFLQA